MKKENTIGEWIEECPTLYDKLLRIQMISDTKLNNYNDIKIAQRCLIDIHNLSSLAKIQFSKFCGKDK